MRHIHLGTIAAIIIYLMAMAATATYYAAEDKILNGSRITNLPIYWGNVSNTTPGALSAVTKGYAIEKLQPHCTYYTVSSTQCNGGYCYATQFTADGVCNAKNSSSYASAYYFRDNFATSANAWYGNLWTSTPVDDYGLASGGANIVAAPASWDTGIIDGVYCCK